MRYMCRLIGHWCSFVSRMGPATGTAAKCTFSFILFCVIICTGNWNWAVVQGESIKLDVRAEPACLLSSKIERVQYVLLKTNGDHVPLDPRGPGGQIWHLQSRQRIQRNYQASLCLCHDHQYTLLCSAIKSTILSICTFYITNLKLIMQSWNTRDT